MEGDIKTGMGEIKTEKPHDGSVNTKVNKIKFAASVAVVVVVATIVVIARNSQANNCRICNV